MTKVITSSFIVLNTLLLLLLPVQAQRTQNSERIFKIPVHTNTKGEPIWEGKWIGILTQPDRQFNYRVSLRRIGNSEFSGTSRIEASGNSNFFGVMELKGTVIDNILYIQEIEIVSQNPIPGLNWCLKKGNLQMTVYNNVTFLNGTWSDPGCNAGQVQLRRQ